MKTNNPEINEPKEENEPTIDIKKFPITANRVKTYKLSDKIDFNNCNPM